MRHLKRNRRNLQRIDSFYGYALQLVRLQVSRITRTRSRTPSETRQLRKLQHEGQFAQHVCAVESAAMF